MNYSIDDKFYSCKYDRAFKEVFLKEENKDLLKALLETILKVKISDITLIPNELNGGNLKVKRKTLDALIDSNKGKIGIEVNANNKPYVRPRNMAYICDVYSSNTLVNQTYTQNVDIIQINLSFELGKNNGKSALYRVMDENGNLYVKNFKIYEINMDYYLNLWYDKNEKEIKDNEFLVMLGLDKDELNTFSKTFKNEKVEKYMSEINKVNEDAKFRRYITEEQDQEFIKNSMFQEGLEQGLEKGVEQGIAQGIEKGSYNKQIEIAKNLLKSGIDIKIISNSTGLSINEINKLKN